MKVNALPEILQETFVYVSSARMLSRGYLTAKESRKASIWFSILYSIGSEGEGVGSGTQDNVELVSRGLCYSYLLMTPIFFL